MRIARVDVEPSTLVASASLYGELAATQFLATADPTNTGEPFPHP